VSRIRRPQLAEKLAYHEKPQRDREYQGEDRVLDWLSGEWLSPQMAREVLILRIDNQTGKS
jgi:hypothetical protein